MEHERVLIVDDEKNIRLTLAQALEAMDLEVTTAASGREALERLAEDTYWLVLLDLKMPGFDGMEVLRRLREAWPDVRVIMITAHGTIDNAVEAMKLGAVDFIQKPFSIAEIRALVRQVHEREALSAEQADTYEAYLELARRGITHRQFDDAAEHVRRALQLDRTHPEAYNLLGVLHEIRGDRFEAQQSYRKALELDPAYEAARVNLKQSVEPGGKGSFMLEETKRGLSDDAE